MIATPDLTNPHIPAQLRSLTYYSLDNDLLQNAVFHAGRLHGLDPRNGDAAHLLSLCHFRLGQYRSAYDYARDKGLRGQHLGCAYVFAQSCLQLGRFADGVTALDRTRGLWAARNHWNKHTETSRRHLPDAAAVYYLLGKLWMAYGDSNKAVEFFVEALKLNPFMWDAFSELCHTGVAIKATNVFKLTSEMLAESTTQSTSFESSNQGILPLQPHVNGVVTPGGHDPFNPKQRPNTIMHDPSVLKESNNVPAADWETPNGNSTTLHDDDTTMDDAFDSEAPHPPRKPRQPYMYSEGYPMDPSKMKGITTRSRTKADTDEGESSVAIRPTGIPVSHKRNISGVAPMSAVSSGQHANASTEPPGAPNRRSDRLLRSRILPSSRLASAASGSKDPSESKSGLRKLKPTGTKNKASGVGRIVSGNRKPLEPNDDAKTSSRMASIASVVNAGVNGTRKLPTAANTAEIAPQKEALAFLIDQYARLGKGYLSLSRYETADALNAFDSLLPQFRETPWCLAQIGRAFYERSAYTEAELHFSKVRKLAQSRTEDMEYYSTTLWHLRRDIDLSYLSHELLEADRLSPQAWCALGNAFSLQGEHERAVRCFRRATQLDGKFAYAFTLQGHEYVASEEFDKALLAYRNAIGADARHYNGWYGLGQVFERLGRFEVAREHYAAAGRINPRNAVLKMCLGWVTEKTCEEPGTTNSAGQPTILSIAEKKRRREFALQCYDEAVLFDVRSTKARSHKARVLMVLKRADEARGELEELKELTPDNAQVYFLLGRASREMHDPKNALRYFTTALSLDPKAANLIKEQMEIIQDGDSDEDDMDGFDME